MEKQKQQRKAENSWNKKQQEQQMSKLMNRLNKDQMSKKEERKLMEMELRNHNNSISTMGKSQFYEKQDNRKSFNDFIVTQDSHRLDQLKQDLRGQSEQNYVQNRIKRNQQYERKDKDREQEHKHMKRVQQMEEESLKNYYDIQNRHRQNMNLFQKHQELMKENQQHKKINQKFVQSQHDILSHLHRDERSQRMGTIKKTQEVLQNQMKQFKEKKNMERSYILEGNQLQKSIFRSLLHDDTYNKKKYAEKLREQMLEENERKTFYNRDLKEKFEVRGIYGGEHGQQRQKQIQIIDKRLGLYQNTSKSNNKHEETKEVKLDNLKQVQNKRQLSRSMIVNPEAEPSPPNHDRGSPVHFSSQKKEKQSYRTFDILTGKSRYYI